MALKTVKIIQGWKRLQTKKSTKKSGPPPCFTTPPPKWTSGPLFYTFFFETFPKEWRIMVKERIPRDEQVLILTTKTTTQGQPQSQHQRQPWIQPEWKKFVLSAHFQRLSGPTNVEFVLHNVKLDQTVFVTKSVKGACQRKLRTIYRRLDTKPFQPNYTIVGHQPIICVNFLGEKVCE